jgi:hypothetical protein
MTTIDQVQGADSLKVFFRMYYDDFLRDYKLYDPDYNFEKEPGDQSLPSDLINKYFNNKVHIYVNNKLLTGTLLTVDIPYNYEIILTLLYQSDKKPKKFKIRNQVLTGLYSDQTNWIFFSINKYEATMKLTPKHFKEICRLK